MALWISVLAVRRVISPGPMPVVNGSPEEEAARREVVEAAGRGRFVAEEAWNRSPAWRQTVLLALRTGRASIIGKPTESGSRLVRLAVTETDEAAVLAIAAPYPVIHRNVVETLRRIGRGPGTPPHLRGAFGGLSIEQFLEIQVAPARERVGAK